MEFLKNKQLQLGVAVLVVIGVATLALQQLQPRHPPLPSLPGSPILGQLSNIPVNIYDAIEASEGVVLKGDQHNIFTCDGTVSIEILPEGTDARTDNTTRWFMYRYTENDTPDNFEGPFYIGAGEWRAAPQMHEAYTNLLNRQGTFTTIDPGEMYYIMSQLDFWVDCTAGMELYCSKMEDLSHETIDALCLHDVLPSQAEELCIDHCLDQSMVAFGSAEDPDVFDCRINDDDDVIIGNEDPNEVSTCCLCGIPCAVDAHCDDGNLCTTDTCEQQDADIYGNPGGPLVCRSLPNTVPGCGACHMDSDCDDASPCTDNVCFNGMCKMYSVVPPPPGCAATECNDGVDNDGDLLIDFGTDPFVNDPDCADPDDDSEARPVCGNGVVEDGEECEELVHCSESEVCVGCSCIPMPVCGDGVVVPTFEECDQGGTCEDYPITTCFQDSDCPTGSCELRDQDGCDKFCTIEKGWHCENEPGQPSQCDVLTPTLPQDSGQGVGNLYVTIGGSLPSHQMLSGQLGEPALLLNFRAEGADISVTGLMVTASSATPVESINRLEFYVQGSDTSFAWATTDPANCHIAPPPNTTTFCTDRDFLIPEGRDNRVVVEVRPRLFDSNTAESGERFSLTIQPQLFTEEGPLQAHVDGSNPVIELVQNDADTTAEGEIFIGTDSPRRNDSITGNDNVVVYGKFAVIERFAELGPFAVPVGMDTLSNIQFTTPDQDGDVVIDSLIFSIDVKDVLMESVNDVQHPSFSIFNESDPTLSAPCFVLYTNGDPFPFDKVSTGPFLVMCEHLEDSLVNSRIDPDSSLVLSLAGEVINPNVALCESDDPPSCRVSHLQVNLTSFTHASSPFSALGSHIQWHDDNTVFHWVEPNDAPNPNNPEINCIEAPVYGTRFET